MPIYKNARAYLEEVVSRYRGLTTCSDQGRSQRPHCRQDEVCIFETDYRAPGDFRFSFDTPHPYRPLRHRVSRKIVGIADSQPYFFSRTHSGARRLDHPESLDFAIAGATGISQGTAHTIAALLFSEVSGFSLLDLHRIRFRPHRVVDNVRCVSVTGLHPLARGGRFTAWFGEQDFLLRRMVFNHSLTEELRTNIQVGHSIANERFIPPRVDVDPSCMTASE